MGSEMCIRDRRKAQDRMKKARPYGEKIRNVAAHMSRANTEYRHPFLIERDTVKRIGIIIVTSDKGLCGGLNTNLLRKTINQMKVWQAAGINPLVMAVNLSAVQFRRANLAEQTRPGKIVAFPRQTGGGSRPIAPHSSRAGP